MTTLVMMLQREESDESDLSDESVPTPKRRKLAREDGLKKALDSGLYPQFLGVASPSDLTNPLSTCSLEFVKILWPDSLCEYIASQTNAYAIEEFNAYILYKHNCKREDVRPMISKCFRASIARELFSLTKKKYTSGLNPRIVESPSSGVCTFVKAADVGLKRGRCHLCVREKARAEQKYTVYACSVCKVRLCVLHVIMLYAECKL